MKTVLKFFLSLTLIFASLGGGCLLYYSIVTAGLELDKSKLDAPPAKCSVRYSDGTAAEYVSSIYEKSENLPSTLKNAFIAIEDKRFYKHGGVDPKAMLRALKNNLFEKGFKEGASTITQQLVKNTYLSGEKTINRKLKEIKLATMLENSYSKDEILEKYLNKIYFGDGAYGITAAAKRFFGKTPNELTIAECATLAATVKAPSTYNPRSYYEKCMKRKDVVLKEMLTQRMISDDEYVKAKNEKIILAKNEKSSENNLLFVEETINEALQVLNLTTADELSGYKLCTSIDKDVQNSLPDTPDYYADCEYASLVIDNRNGKILAYKSSVGQVKRCPASCAKPWLIYAPALEEGIITQASKILDEKTNFDGYSPSNHGEKYFGYVSAKFALCKSLNVPAVKLATSIGLNKIKKYANKMDVNYTNDDLSVALGNLSGGITLTELSSAYATLANGGTYRKIGFLTEIISPNGKTVWQRAPLETKVFSSETCYITSDMLAETAKIGTAKKLSALKFPVCAKTGTNGTKNGNDDAYCVAYTPEYTVGVWLGSLNGEPMPNEVSGGTYPTIIAGDALKNLYRDKTPSVFKKPDDVVPVKLNKSAYENEHKLYLARDGEESLEFIFEKNSAPTEFLPLNITPIIKDYKITYNNEEILLEVKADENVKYVIFDEDNGIDLNGSGNGSFKLDGLKPSTTYRLKICPFFFEEDRKIEGTVINLPAVKTDGFKINGIDWWTDE